jgi:hypothetical protein
MNDLFLLSQAQMRRIRIKPYFPLSHGVPRVDDRLVISGIVFGYRAAHPGDRQVETHVASNSTDEVFIMHGRSAIIHCRAGGEFFRPIPEK